MKEYIFKTNAITRCFECPFRDGLYCLACDDKPINKYRGVKTRESFCPLVELPPHGRLGDLDNVRKAIEDGIEAMARSGITVDGGHLWRILNDALDNAPTIVEASE